MEPLPCRFQCLLVLAEQTSCLEALHRIILRQQARYKGMNLKSEVSLAQVLELQSILERALCVKLYHAEESRWRGMEMPPRCCVYTQGQLYPSISSTRYSLTAAFSPLPPLCTAWIDLWPKRHVTLSIMQLVYAICLNAIHLVGSHGTCLSRQSAIHTSWNFLSYWSSIIM